MFRYYLVILFVLCMFVQTPAVSLERVVGGITQDKMATNMALKSMSSIFKAVSSQVSKIQNCMNQGMAYDSTQDACIEMQTNGSANYHVECIRFGIFTSYENRCFKIDNRTGSVECRVVSLGGNSELSCLPPPFSNTGVTDGNYDLSCEFDMQTNNNFSFSVICTRTERESGTFEVSSWNTNVWDGPYSGY